MPYLPPLPRVKRYFRVSMADPPWRFVSNSDARPGRNARRHYPTMTVDEIAQISIGNLMADDALLFLWITGPLLVLGVHLRIFDAWNFKPSGMGFVWIKTRKTANVRAFSADDLVMGGGHTTRKNAEFCVIGKRGRSLRRDNAVREVIIAPRREHSRKPDEVYERIERYAEGPYLELFARNNRPGWAVWGNETDKFQGAV